MGVHHTVGQNKQKLISIKLSLFSYSTSFFYKYVLCAQKNRPTETVLSSKQNIGFP